MGGGGSPTLNLVAQRYRDDDGSESAATWLAEAGGNINRDLDTNTRLRMLVDNSGTKDSNNLTLQLQARIGAGTWNDVNASSSNIRMSASSNLTEGNDTTEQMAGARTFDTTNGGQEDGDGVTASNTLALNTEIEVEYCFQARSADLSGGESITFRVVAGGGTPMDSDSSGSPTMTINIPDRNITSVGAIASAEAIPTTHKLSMNITGAGAIASAENVPTAAEVKHVQSITLTSGIASAENVPTTAEITTGAVTIDAVGQGIGTSEAHSNTHQLNMNIAGAGAIDTSAAFGTTTLNMNITGAGNIGSTEAFGTAAVTHAGGGGGGGGNVEQRPGGASWKDMQKRRT